MVKISFFLLGYRKVCIQSEALADAVSRFIKDGLTPYAESDGTIYIKEREAKRAEEILTKLGEYELSDTQGLLGSLLRVKNKIGILLGIIFSIFMCVLLQNVVWDVRVDGNDTISDSAVIYELYSSGFGIGNIWSDTDTAEVESELLSKSENISWVNINRRGSVAYVSVIEKNKEISYEQKEAAGGYANIVATSDCIIVDITVKRGCAEVKVGDVVKAGDILISGVLPISAGGGFCYAEGEVIGKMSDVVVAEVDRKYEKNVGIVQNAIGGSIKIFNFPINIFKRYGNSYEGCDIIEDVKVFSLPSDKRLPISFVTTYATQRITKDALYTDDELISLATVRLNSKTITRLSGADLDKIRTYGSFTDTGYRMYSEIVFTDEVGRTQEFEID
ncbi:MAG: sporulation protein YqfD [Clostridia bacterium]|nr:sporulation protein YqfD [Clostridia bacterium]